MLHNVNPPWVKGRALLYLAIFINMTVLVAALFAHQNLFWIIAASVPLLIITIYIGQLQNFYFRPLSNVSKQNLLGRLRYSFRNDKIKESDLKFIIGNEQCSQPYNASFFNTKTKKEHQSSFLNKPASKNSNGYYLADGGKVWQIGPDYAGCSTEQGNFNSEVFKENVSHAEIKMIELKLTPETRSFYSGISGTCFNKKSIFYEASAFNVFRNAEAMIIFLKSLRDISGGKPVGMRLVPNNKNEFYSICHAICKTQIVPDFIVVEGEVDDTNKSQLYKHHDKEKALYEALLFVDETLRRYGIRSKIKIISSGKVSSALDILKQITLGADGVFTMKHEDKENASAIYNSKMSMPSHKELYNATLGLMNSLRFTSVQELTLANFFSKLKIKQPEAVSRQNNIAFASAPEIERKTFKIETFKTKNEVSTVW